MYLLGLTSKITLTEAEFRFRENFSVYLTQQNPNDYETT